LRVRLIGSENTGLVKTIPGGLAANVKNSVSTAARRSPSAKNSRSPRLRSRNSALNRALMLAASVTPAPIMGTGTEIRARNSVIRGGRALGQQQLSAATRQHAKCAEREAFSFTLITLRNIASIQNSGGQ